MYTRKDREKWLKGRKVHGVLNGKIACNQNMSICWPHTFSKDLREITCKNCRRVLRCTKCSVTVQ